MIDYKSTLNFGLKYVYEHNQTKQIQIKITNLNNAYKIYKKKKCITNVNMHVNKIEQKFTFIST